MNKSFWYERVIYYGMGAGLVISIGSFFLMTESSRAYRFSSRNTPRLDSWMSILSDLIILGVLIFVFFLIYGVAIAMGIGPSRTLQDVTVESKVTTLADGSPTFEGTPDDVPVKRYLRLRTEDGETIEARCADAVYHACREGTVGNAKVTGSKLVSFEISGSRG